MVAETGTASGYATNASGTTSAPSSNSLARAATTPVRSAARLMEMLRMCKHTKGLISPPLRQKYKPSRSSAQYVKKGKSVDFCVQGIAAELQLRLRPDLMLPNHFHCPLSTGGRQITMPMHRYKPQAESPEAKCPRFALIRCRMRSRALRGIERGR